MMTSTPAASFRKSACPSGAFMLRAMERLFRFTYEKAARRWLSPSSSAGVSILRTSAPMSASIIPGISAGGTRASSRTLMPSRTPIPFSSWMPLTLPSPPGRGNNASLSPQGRGQGEGWLAIRVRGLNGRSPESRVVAREHAPAHETGDGLQALDRVHGPRGIPHHAGRNLLVDRLLPVAAIAGQDHRARLRQLHEERLMPGRVAVASQHGHPGHDLRVAVEKAPALLRQVEVLLVVVRREEASGIVRVRILVLLDGDLRGWEEKGPAGVIVVEVREHHHVHVARLEADPVEPAHEQIRLAELRERIVAQEAGHGARREAGVEEDGGVAGAHQVAGDGDLDLFRRALAEEEPRLLEAHEAVLERVQPLDGHLGGGFARNASPRAAARRRKLLRIVDPDLVGGREAHGDGLLVQENADGARVGRHLGDGELDARPHAALPEEMQELAIRLGLLGDALHHEGCALRRLGEGNRIVGLGLRHAGNGVAVWTGRRHAQHLREALLHHGRQGVLQTVRLVVSARPVEAENVGEPALEEAMAPRHGLGDVEAPGGEADFLLARHLDVALALHAAQRLGDGGSRDVHVTGEPRADDGLVASREIVDGAEIILDGRGRFHAQRIPLGLPRGQVRAILPAPATVLVPRATEEVTMDFALTEQQELIRKEVAALARSFSLDYW